MSDKEGYRKVYDDILAQCEKQDTSIFRGVNRRYLDNASLLDKQYRLNSKLYRMLIEKYLYSPQKTSASLKQIEQKIIERAQRLFPHQDLEQIRTEMQHYGGATNQIDFSKDINVALFFACDGEYNQDGELFILDRAKIEEKKYNEKIWGQWGKIDIKDPFINQNSSGRVKIQKSVFVRPERGYIKVPLSLPAINIIERVPIGNSDKLKILRHLSKYHGIDKNTIFNDIIGFVENEENYILASSELCYNESQKYRKLKEYQEVIKYATRAMKLGNQRAELHLWQGEAYKGLHQEGKASKCYKKVIEITTQNINAGAQQAELYFFRGSAYEVLGQKEKATDDFGKYEQLMQKRKI